MQITRQRVRPALDITTAETCPSCFGKGEVQPSLLFTDTLYEKLEYVVNTLGLKGFIMYVHPFVDAYIKRGLFTSMYGKWRRKLGRCFKVLPDQSLAYLQYRVLDSEKNEIDLKEEKDMNASKADKVTNKARQRGAAAENLSDLELAEEAVPAATAGDTEAKPKRKRKRKKNPAAAQAETPETAPQTEAIPTAEPAQEAQAPPADADARPEAPKEKPKAKPRPRKRPAQKDAATAEATAEPTLDPAKTLPPPRSNQPEE